MTHKAKSPYNSAQKKDILIIHGVWVQAFSSILSISHHLTHLRSIDITMAGALRQAETRVFKGEFRFMKRLIDILYLIL